MIAIAAEDVSGLETPVASLLPESPTRYRDCRSMVGVHYRHSVTRIEE
jgi:hypothetical protein